MKKLLLTLGFVLQCLLGNTQEKMNYQSDEELNTKIYTLSQEEQYEEVLIELNKLSSNDSIYNSKLVSKSFYLMELKKHKEALEVLNEALDEGEEKNRVSFYVNKYICHQNLGDFENAFKTLDKAIGEFPMNANLAMRKGILYEKQEKYKLALKFYEQALKMAPFDENIHLKIGNLFLKQHLTAQALMCFDMYLMLSPDGDSSFSVLNSLNDVLSKDNDLEKVKGLKLSNEEEDFEELDLILDSRISLSKKYKISNEIKIAYTKQNHVLLQKLEELDLSEGLWAEKYVPFYKWIFDNGHFDNFIYTTTYSIENKKYKKIVDKKVKEIEAFLPIAYDKWEEIMKMNVWTIEGKKVKLASSFLDRKVEGIGSLVDGKFNGDWRFYKPSGKLNSEGAFNTEEKRTGIWKWYFDNGNAEQIANYKNGSLEGEFLEFFDNGNKYNKTNYSEGKLNGLYELYYKTGGVKQIKNFMDGELNGSYQSFHKAGSVTPKYILNFSKGEQEGQFVEKTVEGVDIFNVNKKEGKKEGLETNRYNSGLVKSTYQYKNGLEEGVIKKFHKNGIVKTVGQAVGGVYAGEWKSYYSNGALKQKSFYKKGEYDGVSIDYYVSGEVFREFIYRKGELIGYKFLNKSGEVIKEGKKKGGEFFYEGYSMNGSIITKGIYDVKGGKEGEWKFYSDNGVLETIGNYKEGSLHGENINYHSNGNIKSKELYVNDTLQGYIVKYHEDGKMKSQGYAEDGYYNKEKRTYFKDGSIKEINFYHKGDLHGDQQYYSVEGKQTHVFTYKFGVLSSEKHFGKEGNVLCNIDYEKLVGNKKITMLHENGKPFKIFNFRNGVLHGAYEAYDYYGNILTKGNYLSGSASGKWDWYFQNGQLLSETNYVNGVRHAEYKRYYESGALSEKITYNLGDRVAYEDYTEDGKTLKGKTSYFEEGIDGKRYSYSNEGKLQLIRIYEMGRLIGYSYLDKNKKEIPMIPLVNETGKIIAYFDNGKKSRELEYVNGQLENDYLQYYYSGKLHHKKHFKGNNFYGKSEEFFSNGKLKKETNFHNDDYHGDRKEYYSNGQLKEVKRYVNDEKSGEAKYFDENGELLKTEYYFNDKIYKVEE